MMSEDKPIEPKTAHSLSRLLESVDAAQRNSLTRIFPLIYEELRHIAKRYMGGDRADHTLQPTALVNEAFMRVRDGGARIQSEAHALAVAAIAMRCILVDHARKRTAARRGGHGRRFALHDGEAVDGRALEILELDDLITRLAELDPRRARVVELRFFAGMSNDEIATTLGVARSTVAEDWAVARAWLRMQLKSGKDAGMTHE